MRRSTAAAVGTLTGAALIIGVRLSVTPPEAPVVAAPVEYIDEGLGSVLEGMGSVFAKDQQK